MKFYRYVQIITGDEYARWPNISLITFNLIKETPKGYWIAQGYAGGLMSPKKWIPKQSKKRYAYPTKEEAMNNFIKRTERRIKILESQLKDCSQLLSKAERIRKQL